MSALDRAGTFALGDRRVRRLGYGAMQLAGPHVFGPPRDRDEALAVLREALSPYPADLTQVTKVGAVRGEDASWNLANSPAELEAQVHSNLRTLGVEVLEVVNFRSMLGHGQGGPIEGSIAEPFAALAALRDRGLIRHLGVSNVTAAQVEEARGIAPVVCVQNMYNLAHRDDDALIDRLAGAGIAYVPFFPLGGFSPLQSQALDAVAQELSATPMQVALAWLLRRAPNILLIPGTSSRGHLRENLAAASLALPEEMAARLDGIGGGVSGERAVS